MNKLAKFSMLITTLGVLLVFSSSCDIFARFKCEWYLVPDLSQKDSVEPGWVSVCIRNYNINKQKCFLKAKLALAEEVYAKKFKYYSAEINTDSFPREVKSVEVCEP